MTSYILAAESANVFTATHAVAVVAALATVVTVLWTSLRSFQDRMFTKQEQEILETRNKVDKCESKHEASDARIIELTSRICTLEGREQGVKELAQALLEAVHAANVPRAGVSHEASDGSLHNALHG